jgi:hypothetical protein
LPDPPVPGVVVDQPPADDDDGEDDSLPLDLADLAESVRQQREAEKAKERDQAPTDDDSAPPRS